MKKLTPGLFLRYCIAIICGLVTFIPLIITFLCSVKDNEGINLGMFSLPEKFLWINYAKAFKTASMGRAVFNSIFISAISTLIVVFIAMLAAYILARKHAKGLSFIYSLFIVGIMVPVHCTIIPISTLATAVHGRDSYLYLILVYVAFNLSQAIFLFTGYLKGVNKEMDEAAVLEGCSDIQILFRILFPISIPIITTECILSFVYGYGELIFAMCLIGKKTMYTISRAMLAFQGGYIVELGPIFACIIIAVIPMLSIYLFFHEKVQSGMLSGAVKG